ncbi:MAG: CCA tRNA nucleotidyltransferase [Dehalococcoidia bacterium]|nr:CCA tRNA nucleotidyltransferase [Dehalococcoidia bacterium]
MHHARRTTIAPLLEERLAPSSLELVREAAQFAHARGVPLWLVGGVVRDIMLGRQTLDIDIVAEGDAQALAKGLARWLGGEAVCHPRFGTAKLLARGLSLDIATARTERYQRPGALPAVEASDIASDLHRRDFTINAIAASLAPATFGAILDPCRGRADLDASLIRVMHQRSFLDDPTRLLRAVRYQARFGFRLEADTKRLLSGPAPGIAALSATRRRNELWRILEESEPERPLALAHAAGLLAQVHPTLAWDDWLARRFAAARAAGERAPDTCMALLAFRLSPQAAETLAQGLGLPGSAARAVREGAQLGAMQPSLAQPGLRNSQVHAMLRPFGLPALTACRFAAPDGIIRQRLALFLDILRHVRPVLNGVALHRLGVPQGPATGQALAALLTARLDGTATTIAQEKTIVARYSQ